MPRYVDAPRLIVDLGDPQAFTARIAVGEAAGEELAGGGESVKLEREFVTLITRGC